MELFQDYSYLLSEQTKQPDPFTNTKQPDPFTPKQPDPFTPKKEDPFTPKKEEPKKEEPKKIKERKIDLNKCRKSIEDYYPDKEKYQRDFSFEDVEDAFEREEGKNADQILYSKGTEKRQKQMCARWEDGWRPNFGKPCDETFPIEKWCSNEKVKEIQKCLGLPAERRTGIFDDLTASRLVSKGITPDESEDISEDEYKKLCNKYTSKEQLPSDELFESKIMKIDTTEKNEILKKHLDFKKILQEQKKFLERGLIMEQNVPEIESAKAQGCISKTGRYAVRKSGRNTGKTAWVITATKDGQKWKIDDDIWIYPNGECEVFDQNEFIFHENCWSCDKARQTTQVKTVEDFIFNGWLEYDDIDVNFKEKDNPNFFLKVPVLGAKDGYMYFPVWKKNIVPDNFPENSPQGKWIESIKTNYPKMVINPTDEEIDRLSLVEIPIKGSEKYFPFGLKIYYNKSNISQYKSDELQSSKFRTSRTPSLVECEKEINNFWEDFVQKTEINTNELKFKEQKLFVQACAAMYYKNWKPREIDGKKESLGGFAGIGSGRAILDAKLGALGGVKDYDGTPRATENVGRRLNPWRIVLPQRK